MGHRPRDLDGCVEWLNSLQNSDSGFGDRPAWRSRRGGHSTNHVSNWIIAPSMTADQSHQYDVANRTGMKDLLWPEFGRQVIAPMRILGSLVYPEMEYGMISAYEVYDDGLDGPSGYTAVVAGMGWPPTDWVRHFPYRDRWIGRLPMIFDCDAHGSVTEWRLQIQKGRTLYIAESHLLEAFLEACSNHRTVCAIRDEDVSEGVVYYGSRNAVAYVKKHRDQWQWWKNTRIRTR